MRFLARCVSIYCEVIYIKNAVIFAKEILQKKKAVLETSSYKLKKEYRKSIQEDLEELQYYCDAMGLSVSEVLRRAEEESNT